MDTTEAAVLLGHPAHEVAQVADRDDGTVITMFDGHAYILVDEGRPDGAGKHGLMYHREPIAGYRGSFPVFTPHPQAAQEPPEAPAAPDDAPGAVEPGEATAAAVPVKAKATSKKASS